MQVRELLAIDKKKLSQRFVKDYCCPDHFYRTLKEVLNAECGAHGDKECGGDDDEVREEAPFCVLHGRACCLPAVKADLLVAGSPCAPFSGQRRDRYSSQGRVP